MFLHKWSKQMTKNAYFQTPPQNFRGLKTDIFDLFSKQSWREFQTQLLQINWCHFSTNHIQTSTSVKSLSRSLKFQKSLSRSTLLSVGDPCTPCPHFLLFWSPITTTPLFLCFLFITHYRWNCSSQVFFSFFILTSVISVTSHCRDFVPW